MPELLDGGVDQALLTEAQGNAPQARHRLDVGVVLLIEDPHAVAAGDHEGADFLVLRQVGVGVNE
ncbi:hypothetical protein [Pseudomonas sp. NBRC 111130]|uniref:hypothetical protein n=1 Tax=Pseudomonas sp. NBRC 111130 TaxID=1661045 RepID=UPI00210B0D0C|nr:hypothetical protein [Pseudomonas sp. NBRC 111130]